MSIGHYVDEHACTFTIFCVQLLISVFCIVICYVLTKYDKLCLKQTINKKDLENIK
jgi:hypothetical protein